MGEHLIVMSAVHKIKEGYDHMTPEIKHAIDVGALGITLTTVMQVVPPITASLSLVWVCLRIYESIQNIRKNHRDMKNETKPRA